MSILSGVLANLLRKILKKEKIMKTAIILFGIVLSVGTMVFNSADNVMNVENSKHDMIEQAFQK